MNISRKLSPLQQNENPMVPSLTCGDRVWKAEELIAALRHGSGVAREAIYDMTTHCVTHILAHGAIHGITPGEILGDASPVDGPDTIKEISACILAVVYHGALRRPEFLPDFIEIVTRMFLRQQLPAEGVESSCADAADCLVATPPGKRATISTPRRGGRPRRRSAGREVIRAKS